MSSFSGEVPGASQSLWAVILLRFDAEPLDVDPVLRLPAVDVVLGHAALGELLPAIVLPRGERAEQRVAPDLLVAAGVVDLVELVAAAELCADGVPQELHQLDPLDRLDSARAPHI